MNGETRGTLKNRAGDGGIIHGNSFSFAFIPVEAWSFNANVSLSLDKHDFHKGRRRGYVEEGGCLGIQKGKNWNISCSSFTGK